MKFSQMLAKHKPVDIAKSGCYFSTNGLACFNGWIVADALGKKPKTVLKVAETELQASMLKGGLGDWVANKMIDYAKKHKADFETTPSNDKIRKMVQHLNAIHVDFYLNSSPTRQDSVFNKALSYIKRLKL